MKITGKEREKLASMTWNVKKEIAIGTKTRKLYI